MRRELHCWVISQVLENRLQLGEALGWDQVARLGGKPEKLRAQVARNIRELAEKEPPAGLYRRHVAREPSVTSITFDLEAPTATTAWRAPLRLTFPVLRWCHMASRAPGEPLGAEQTVDMELAFVPALGIVIAAERARKLDERLIPEIRAALARGKPLTLARLVELQRADRVRLERVTVPVQLRSAKAQAQAAQEGTQTSVLAQVATDVRREPAVTFFGRETLLDQLAELVGGRVPRSVLLVGASGVGKTALFRALADQRARRHLGATPFFATSGARLVAGMCGYGMWQERCQHMVREASRKKIILHLGNLVELMSVGKSEHNLQGLAAFLRPYVAHGDLLAVSECTPEQAALIEREDPHLLDAFHRFDVAEPDAEEGRAILRACADHLFPDRNAGLSTAALATLDALHRRYATYSAYPGRPLRFLRNLLQDSPRDADLASADVLTAFTRETGLPRVLLDPAVRLDLTETATWFNRRVIDQPEAVDLIVELLAGVKAWLTRPRRPIGSLLFIGPTGVGKTEMAKTLAEFLFGSRARLTRFDMSEFGDPLAVQRLVGDAFGGEGLLTAKVREQPFSVLLLDEFEKAHPRFFDLLLQVLGEGRLTDAAGRLADFSNTVIILTSNLGAESFRKGGFGFGDARESSVRAESARAHFTHAVQEHLRPELFNRIDRIVPFLPLSAEAIRRIAEHHLELLASRDGIRYRGVQVTYDGPVVECLAREGFDPRYGARPLLRAMERKLLAPFADAMNRYSAELALSSAVSATEQSLRVDVRPRTGADGQVIRVGTAETPLLEAARSCVERRRRTQAIEACAAMRELNNELFELEREQERAERAQLKHAARMARASEQARQRLAAAAPVRAKADEQRQARLARLRTMAARLQKLSSQTRALEEVALHALYAGPGEPSLPPNELMEAAEPLRTESDAFLLALYCRQFPSPDAVTLAFFSEDAASLLELAQTYCSVAEAHAGYSTKVVAYRLPKAVDARPAEAKKAEEPREEAKEPPARRWRDDRLIAASVGRKPEQELLVREWLLPSALWSAPPAHLIGVAVRLSGPAAAPRFGSESGLQTFITPKRSQPTRCLVEVTDATLPSYLPPEGITRRGAIGNQDERRTYNQNQQVVVDALLKQRIPWQNQSLSSLLAELLGTLLERRMLALLEV